MTPEERERVNTLCKEIQFELDPARFTVLIEELGQLLTKSERERRERIGLNYAVSIH